MPKGKMSNGKITVFFFDIFTFDVIQENRVFIVDIFLFSSIIIRSIENENTQVNTIAESIHQRFGYSYKEMLSWQS
jgi:hypothetical protein